MSALRFDSTANEDADVGTMNSLFRLLLLAAFALGCRPLVAAEWGTLAGMHDYHQAFGLDSKAKDFPVKLTMLSANAAGNVFHEGEQPEFVFQVENLTDEPLRMTGEARVIRYALVTFPGDQWWPQVKRLATVGSLPLSLDLPARGWQNLTVRPETPATKGGYALIVDFGEHGRQYLTSYVRTFKPALQRVQYPKQALEDMPPEILKRLGVQAVRYGVPYLASDEPRYEERLAFLNAEFAAMHANLVTCVAEIGAGSRHQPLGRGRPHLDAQGVMQGGKEDLVWLPEYDDDYEAFVYKLASTYGWPKGPITGFMLWNEPWEGMSISGWGADMLRYRELYKRLGRAVARANREAGVEVLVGGCDSSSNTWDKLFPDGSDEFLPYFDFCSIHYQGLSAPVLYPEWNNRKQGKGRVLIWDTESWVANADDRFAGVVASNRAAGYDRALGTLSRIAVSTMSHHRIAYDTVRTEAGTEKRPRLIESRPLAAAYGAGQHFIGEREFREILFKTGLPWVYVFQGLNGNPDDGTVVVLGDLGALFGQKAATHLFHTVRSLDETALVEQVQTACDKLPPTAVEQRAELREKLAEPRPFTNARLTLKTDGNAFTLFDYYGNPVPPTDGRIIIPLDDRSFFLRADPNQPGSFERLLAALRAARIDGLEPLEIIPYDLTEPIDRQPVMRLRLTSQLNRAVGGALSVTLGNQTLAYPKTLSFRPRERKWLDVRIVAGTATPNNTYPLRVRFDAANDGVAFHAEDMHVNWISHQTIRVDGDLNDWRGALPQTIDATGGGGPSFQERMWLPFEKFSASAPAGFATAYLAYDDANFYFAARIADDTPHPGTLRFATRDHDADFYPATCLEKFTPKPPNRKAGEPAPEPREEIRELTWPNGVRRFSYRRWPALPSSYSKVPFDNVLLGFNALPLGQDGWESHLPGRMPKFIWFKTTDYEYALNSVAPEHGGGTEVWRLQVPGMPRKHFYPRQPKHPLEGAVDDARLVVRYQGGMRLVECSLPWAEIPHVKALLDAAKPVKFSYRVNHDTRSPDMELAAGRASCQGLSNSFHPDWARSWPNELEFGWER